MTDIVDVLRSGKPCSEAGGYGGVCKVMDTKSGCSCAIAADQIELLRSQNGLLNEHIIELHTDNHRLRMALWDVHAMLNNGPIVFTGNVKKFILKTLGKLPAAPGGDND